MPCDRQDRLILDGSLRLADLGPDGVERQAEGVGDRCDGREGGGSHTAGFDLPQSFRGDVRSERHVQHRAAAPGSAEQGAKALSAFYLGGGERQPDLTMTPFKYRYSYTGIVIGRT